MTPTSRLAVELRSARMSGDTLVGHAAVYGQPAQIRGGWEAIAAGAFDEVLRGGEDVVALRDHNPSLLLGRTSAGTLRLHSDGRGLAFEVDLPDTGTGRDVRELVRRGDLRGASFGFLPGRDELGHARDGRLLRTHTSIKRLLDVSVVALPAYEGTTVALGSTRPLVGSHRSRPLDRRTQMILIRHRVRYGQTLDHRTQPRRNHR